MASVESETSADGIRIGGWSIEARKLPIIGEADIQDITSSLGNVLCLPESTFGNSFLRLTHEASGVCIDFNARDALHEWKRENIPPLRVRAAAEWQKARKREIEQQNASVLEYDWTFTTPYCGSVRPRESSTDAFSSWVSTQEQIDRSLLMEREPILYYEDVPLYESDLDDFGLVRLGVKIRVMPKCWFVLLRFWLKVDDNLVRMRETRMFSRWDKSELAHTVLREIKHCEASFEELRKAGALPSGFLDADSSANTFSAIAPAGLQKYVVEKLTIPKTGQDSAAADSGPVTDGTDETDV